MIANKYGDGKPRNDSTEIHPERDGHGSAEPRQRHVTEYLLYNGLASSMCGERVEVVTRKPSESKAAEEVVHPHARDPKRGDLFMVRLKEA